MRKPRSTNFTPCHFVLAIARALKVLCFAYTSHTRDWLTTREPISVSTGRFATSTKKNNNNKNSRIQDSAPAKQMNQVIQLDSDRPTEELTQYM